MKSIAVVTAPSIYHGRSAQKTVWDEKVTPVNMRRCGRHNVRKHRESKNGEQYIALDISLKVDCLKKSEFTSSRSMDYVVISGKGVTTYITLRTKIPNKKQN